MKKMLGKRFMFLVALLVGLCIPAMAQRDFSGNALDQDLTYYVRNVGTGLYLKYGAEYGTHVAEGIAAHPIVIESNGDGTYAIASIVGYLAGHGSAVGYFDRPQSESKWTLEAVGATNKCYIMSQGRALASSGNVAGSVYLRAFDANDLCQQWEFVRDVNIRPSQPSVLATPLDLTALIKSSSFDWVDGAMSYTAPYSDFESHNSYYINNWVALDGDKLLNNTGNGEKLDDESWWAWHWDSERELDPTRYASSGVLRNNARSAFTMSQNIGRLPAGTYTFSFEGFSRVLWEIKTYVLGDYYGSVDYPVYVEILDASGVKLNTGDVRLLENKKILENGDYHKLCIGGNEYKVNGLTKNDYAAAEFKNNDDWKQSITFTLSESKNIQIRLRRPTAVTSKTTINLGGEKYEIDLASKAQCFVAFDNFTLIYHGTQSNDEAWRDLYYDRVRKAYLNATDRLAILAGGSHTDCSLTGCVHWDAWKSVIDGVVTVNGVAWNGADPTDPTVKEAKLNGNVIDTEEEYLETLAKIDEAYQAALNEHNSHLTNYTDKINNHSFEEGEYTVGWMLTSGISDSKIRRYNKSEDNVSGVDGDYHFSSSLSTAGNAPGIAQIVTGLPSGLYLLEAKLTANAGNYVYLLGNNQNDFIVAEAPNKFENASLYFLVGDDGNAVIGAAGGNNRSGRDSEYKYYYPEGGCSFKADDFHLTYVCDVPNGKLRLALDEAQKAYASLDVFGQNSDIETTLDIYEGYYLGKSATVANVDSYVTAIHEALNAAAKKQSTIGADMTYAIVNPNFEWNPANYDGWTTTNGDDTGVKEQNHGTYMTAGAVGGYLFNTWKSNVAIRKEGCEQNDYNKPKTYEVAYESAEPIRQTLTSLPKGKYQLDVMVASHKGETIQVTANGVTREVTVQNDKTIGEFVSVPCEITDDDGTLEIEVGGKSKTVSGTLTYYYKESFIVSWVEKGTTDYSYTYTPWFKADDFRLTLLEPDVLTLDEKATFVPAIDGEEYSTVNVIRSIANTGNWSTFVLPFTANANTLFEDGKCVIKELASVEVDGEHVRLTFSNVVDGRIEAGKPYIIKNESGAKLTALTFTDVEVNTIYTNSDEQTVSYTDENELMKFHGVYHRRAVPGGKFFINGNKFYQAVNQQNPDMISGFRGYFELLPEAKSHGVRGFNFRIGEDTDVATENVGEAKVVAIYNLNGMRLNDMQEGVNILQMSNGTTIKVVIE